MQFRTYRKRMGFTQQLMAQFLDIRTDDGCYSKDGYVEYERTKNYSQPPFDTKLAGYAKRMLVNLNWLADIEGASMWSSDLLRGLRATLRRHIETNPMPRDSAGRIGNLVRFTHAFDSNRYDVLFLAGLCLRTMDQIESVLAGENIEFETPTPDYLAEFWHLRTPWLVAGEGPACDFNFEHRIPALNLLDEYGISNDTIRNNIRALQELEQTERPLVR